MTFNELIILQRDFGQQLPNYRQAASRDEQAKQLNYALRLIGKATKRFDPAVQFNLSAGEARYDLENLSTFGRMIWKPYKVIVNNRQLCDEQGNFRILTWRELNRNYPDFRRKPVGNVMAAAEGSREIWLYMAPSMSTVVAGGNYIEGLVLPGVCYGDICLPEGFPTRTVTEETESSVGSVTATTSTVEAVDTGASSVTNPGNTVADDGATATLNSGAVDLASGVITWDDSAAFRWSDFGVSLPDGAIVDSIRIKTLDMTKPSTVGVRVYWTTDGITPAAIQQDGPTTTAGGSWPTITGLTTSQVENSEFGLILSGYQNGVVFVPFSMSVDFLEIEVAYHVPGTPGTGTGVTEEQRSVCVPELEIELHEALAYCAASMAAEPEADSNEILARLEKYERRYWTAVNEVRAANEAMQSSAEDPGGNRYNDYFRGR